MKIFLQFFLLIFFFSCQNNRPENNTTGKKNSIEQLSEKEKPPSKTDLIKKEPKPIPKIDHLSMEAHPDSLSFRGIRLVISQKKMHELMGQPDSIIDPMYECGFYASSEQDRKFLQYFYGKLNFMVYEEQADLEHVEFKIGDEMIVNEVVLVGGMSFDEAAKALGLEMAGNISKTILTIYPKGLDEQYYLKFENEKLKRFERWTPC